MKVIDISDYQDGINFDLVENDGVKGVIIKVSEGRTLMDFYPKFFNACITHQLQTGAYCLSHAKTVERAAEEATVLMDALEEYGYTDLALGLWIDVEPELSEQLTEDELTSVVSSFISTCNARGYSAGVYGNKATLEKIRTEELADYVPYWCAEPGASYCTFKEENPTLYVVGWQKDFHYYIGSTEVDLNEWD